MCDSTRALQSSQIRRIKKKNLKKSLFSKKSKKFWNWHNDLVFFLFNVIGLAQCFVAYIVEYNSPVQSNTEHFCFIKFSKNHCSPKYLKKKKISEKLQFLMFCQLRRLVFDQSSPVHPVSESRGVV